MKISGNAIILKKISNVLEAEEIEFQTQSKSLDSLEKTTAVEIIQIILKDIVIPGVLYDILKSIIIYDEGESIYVERKDGTKITWNEYLNLSDEELSEYIF